MSGPAAFWTHQGYFLNNQRGGPSLPSFLHTQKKAMRKIGNLNHFSDEYLDKYRLKPRQVVEYQLMNGRPNDDPDTKKDRPMRYPTTVFSLKGPDAGIWDGKKYVPCGVLRNYQLSLGGEVINPVWEKFTVNSPDGMFAVIGGDGLSDEIYFMLEHHPENASTPDVPNFEKKFRRVDRQGEAKLKVAKVNVLREALNFVAQMTESDIKDFASASGWNDREDVSVIVAQITDAATTDPELFLSRANDKKTAFAAIVKRCLEAGILTHDAIQNRYVWGNGDVFAQLERVDGRSALDMVSDYILTGGKEAQTKYAQLKKALKDRTDPPGDK
jgi:hypothetical protein